MEFLQKRSELIKEYHDWGVVTLEPYEVEPIDLPGIQPLIDDRLKIMRRLETQFGGTTEKVRQAEQIREQLLGSDLPRAVLLGMREEVSQSLQQLQAEVREVEALDLDQIARSKKKFDEDIEQMEAIFEVVKDRLKEAIKKDQEYATQFEQLGTYISNRLPSMSIVEQQPLIVPAREQDAQFKKLRKDLGDVLTHRQQACERDYRPLLKQALESRDQILKLENLRSDLMSKQNREVNIVRDVLAMINKRLNKENSVSEYKVPTLTERPTVQIFELTPPPSIDINQGYRDIQREVYVKFRRFQWPAIQVPDRCGCDDAVLNPATKLVYHYQQPFNDVNLLVDHSVGAGKTVTARLPISIFARAGYDNVLVSPLKARRGLITVAFREQADFNVQQYTQGRPADEVIYEDMLSQLRAKKAQISLDDLKEALSKYDVTKESLGKFLKSGRISELQEARQVKDEEERARTPNDILQANLCMYLMLFILEDKMKYRQYQNANDSITYKQLSTLAKDRSDQKAGGVVRKFFDARYKEERKDDLLYKTYITIDEAHNLVAKATSLKENEVPDYRELRKLLHESYKHKKDKKNYEAARVTLLTGTPVAGHPLDAINLILLLYKPENSWGFENYDDVRYHRAKVEQEFMKNEFDPKTQRFRREDKIKQLFAGRISYMNFQGNVANIAQPLLYVDGVRVIPSPEDNPVQYVPVKLSVLQIAAIKNCFLKYSPSFHVDKDKGRFIEMRTRGEFEYDPTKQTLTPKKMTKINFGGSKAKPFNEPRASKKKEENEKPRGKGRGKGKGKMQEEEEEREETREFRGIEEEGEEPRSDQELKECLVINGTWPWLQKASKDEYITAEQFLALSREEVAEMIESGEVDRMYSALVPALLYGVRKKREQAFKALAQYYRGENEREEKGLKKPRDIKKDLKNFKQMIFIDSIKDEVGVKIIAKCLQSMRTNEGQYLQRVNDGDRAVKGAAPYHGFVVFDNNTKNYQPWVDQFNAKDNADGRFIWLALINGKYKESFSLFDVRYEHIAGVIARDNDLRQAVARGIRNCRRKNTPWIPGTGWTIDISIYSPAFGTKEESLYPLEMLEMLRPETVTVELAKKEMMRLIRESAFDKDLMQTINDASQAAEDAVQMWASRRSDRREDSHVGMSL